MHSSRIRTFRKSSRLGGSTPPTTPREQAPAPQEQAHTPGNLQGMLGYPPPRPAARHAGIPPAMHAGIALLPPLWTDRHL